MLVSLFRSNRPGVLLVVPCIVAVLWPGMALVEPGARTAMSGMLLHELVRPVLRSGTWGLAVFSVVMVWALAVQLDRLGNEQGLFRRQQHLAALCLPLVLALLPQGLVPDPALLGMPLVLPALQRVWSTQGAHAALAAHFDAGLLLGAAALVHMPYVFLISVVWASSSVMRPPQWREYVLPLLGASLVLLLAFGVSQVVAPARWNVAASFMPATPAVRPEPIHWVHGVLVAALAVLLGLAALAAFARGYGQGVVREKNTRSAFLALAFALGIIALFDRFTLGYVPPVLVAVPGAVLMAWPLQEARRLVWPETAVLAILVLALWARWN